MGPTRTKCVCVEAMGGEGKGVGGKEMEVWGSGRDGGPEVTVNGEVS